RNPHEGAERLGRLQRRDMRGHAPGKTVADEAGARFGGGELVGIFEIIEEGQVSRTGFVERSQATDLPAAARGIGKRGLRQRGNVCQRGRGRFLEEYRLRHVTRRDQANDRTRAPLPGFGAASRPRSSGTPALRERTQSHQSPLRKTYRRRT